MAKTFEAQIDKWVKATEARQLAVLKMSAQDVIAAAQKPVAQGGNMPVDTGFLRASLVSSLNGGTALSGPDSYVMVIPQITGGGALTFVWTAEYARHVEYGTSRMAGRHFVGSAAAQWGSIVAKNVAAAKARYK